MRRRRCRWLARRRSRCRPTAQAPNSGDAVKTFVDANIQITPNGVNRVGQTHTFTAHVNINAGDGNGFVNAPNGTQISFTIDSGPGCVHDGESVHDRGWDGICTITSARPSTGVTTVSAHTTLSVGGVSLTRQHGRRRVRTPARRRRRGWTRRSRSLRTRRTRSAQPHTFTVTLMKDIGDGAGFVAAAGEHVDFTLTDSNGASFTLNAASSTCDDAGANTNASGSVHDHVHVEHGGEGDRACVLDAVGGGSAAFTVQTDGRGAELGRRGQDVRGREHPDHAADGDEPGRHDAHVHGHVNVNDGRRRGLRERAERDVDQLHDLTSRPGGFVRRRQQLHDGRRRPGTLHGRASRRRLGGTTTIRRYDDVDGRRCLAAPRDRRRHVGANWRRRDEDTGSAAKIAIAPNATNEVGQPHTFTVTLQKDTGSGLRARLRASTSTSR